MTVKVIFVLLAVSNLCESVNILAIIPTPSFSHQIAFRELWKQLSLRGHKITLITTDPMKDATLNNIQEIDMSKAYELWNERYKIPQQAQSGLTYWNVWEFFLDMLSDIIEYEVSQPEIQTLVHDNDKFKFDLVMVELFFQEFLSFGKIYNCPTILMGTIGSTMEILSSFGNTVHPVLNNDLNFPYAGNLNFVERILSTLYYWRHMVFVRRRWIARKQLILDRYLTNGTKTRLEDLINAADLALINESPLLKGIQALGPTTIPVGGANHLKPQKPLPQELKEFLDSAEEGFIYLSLGGNVKSKDLNNQTMSNIMEAFKEIPYKVLWKFEANNLPGKPDNVKLIRWAPQQDVLRHPNIKVFVTQGGILSVEEAIYTHVPMVVMPFYGDQLKNARIIENKEIGKFVNHKPVLLKDEFKSAIFEVIKNEKYKQSITKLANLIQDQPMTGLETAIWWTEYVIRHKGAKQLRNPAADIPLYQYYLLDVISFLALVLYISIRLSIFLVRKSINFLTGKEKLKSA